MTLSGFVIPLRKSMKHARKTTLNIQESISPTVVTNIAKRYISFTNDSSKKTHIQRKTRQRAVDNSLPSLMMSRLRARNVSQKRHKSNGLYNKFSTRSSKLHSTKKSNKKQKKIRLSTAPIVVPSVKVYNNYPWVYALKTAGRKRFQGADRYVKTTHVCLHWNVADIKRFHIVDRYITIISVCGDVPCEIALDRIALDLTDKSTLSHVMARCTQARSHHLSQC